MAVLLSIFEHILTPLLTMSLTAAFVVVVVLLLRFLLKRRAPKQIICLLWLVVFARLLVPVTFETPFSLVPAELQELVPGQVESVENPPASSPQSTTAPGSVVEPPVQTPSTQLPINPTPTVTTPPAVTLTPQNPGTPAPVIPEIPTEDPQPTAPAVPLWLYIVPAVWVAGILAMLIYGAVSFLILHRRVYNAIRTEDGVWEHPNLASPFILGLFRPRIYLPMGIEGQARQFILHHEKAHLRRCDYIIKPICWLALAIHWFNPLAWVAFLLMSRDIETACDESVIRKLGSEIKADYSATLLALATDKRFPAPSPLSFGEGDAKARIKNVLKFKKPALWVSIIAVVIVVAAAVCLLTDPINPVSPPDEPSGNLTLDPLNEPILDEETLSAPVPEFLSEEQELLFLRAYQLYSDMFGMDTSTIDLKGMTGEIHTDTVEFNDEIYTLAQGRYANWADFDAVVHSVFTDRFWESKNGVNGHDYYVDYNGQMAYIWASRGGGISYNYFFPDKFELVSQTNNTLLFNIIGHYNDEPTSNEELENYHKNLPNGYDYIMKFPVRMVRTEDGWRVDEFCDPRIDNYKQEQFPPQYVVNSIPEGMTLLYNDDLVSFFSPNDAPDTVVLQYGDYLQALDGFILGRPYCDTWEADHDGDGTPELYIISPLGSGTGVAVDALTVCEPNGDKLDVWYHDSTDIQSEFNETRTAVYAPESQSISITYGNQTYTHELDDFTAETYMPGASEIAFINGQQITYEMNADGTITLIFTLSIAGETVPMLTYIPVKVSCLIRFNGSGFELVNGLSFYREASSVSDLPKSIVTPDTLPTAPEEYYLVAALPEADTWLYARNHGEDSMLVWENFWWPLKGRIAHTPRMNLPRLYLMDENAQSTTVAAISERVSGTEVSVEQLVVYVMGEHQVDSSYYTGLRQSVYDWSSIHEAFNKKNTLVYDADTNSFTVSWNGKHYNSGELPQDMGYRFALEDGYTGSLFANGSITKFTYVGGNRFGVTVKTAVEARPLSIGETGLDLTWTVEFNGEGFDASVPEITVSDASSVDRPTQLTLPTQRQRLSAATKDFYVIRDDGTLVMWGSPEGVFDGSNISNVPLESPVELMENAVFVDVGFYGGIMVIDESSTLWGLGLRADPSAPNTPRRLMDDVAMVSCGQFDDLILKKDGTLWSHERNNSTLPTLEVQEAYGETYYKLMNNVVSVAAGGFGCGSVTLTDGTHWAWTYQVDGLVEVPDSSDSGVTLYGIHVNNVEEYAVGEFESILLMDEGYLWSLTPDGTLTDISFVLR